MWEKIAIALISHFGIKVIDKLMGKFWDGVIEGKTPVIAPSGILYPAAAQQGRFSVVKTTAVSDREYGVVRGSFIISLMPFSSSSSEVPLILAIEESKQEPLLLSADLREGYTIELSEGIYRFYVFLVDTNADDPAEATIYATGFPCMVDSSYVQRVIARDQDEIWRLLHDAPIQIAGGQTRNLNFLMIPNAELPDSPTLLGQLIGEDKARSRAGVPSTDFDLSGIWNLEETYEFGGTSGEMYIAQFGDEILGRMIVRDIMDDGQEIIIEESISGNIHGKTLEMKGTEVRVIKGPTSDYQLDSWRGVIESNDLIRGSSTDLAETTGIFQLTRSFQQADPEQLEISSTIQRGGGMNFMGKTLRPGDSEYFDMVLQGSTTYSIYVEPEEPSVDFDLYVYDENGNLIDEDTDYDSDALCVITPNWTGPFRIEVKAASGGISDYVMSIEEE